MGVWWGALAVGRRRAGGILGWWGLKWRYGCIVAREVARLVVLGRSGGVGRRCSRAVAEWGGGACEE